MSEIIAKAMNSTLGTSDFKSYDEIMLDHKSIIPTDQVLYVFGENATGYGTNSTDIRYYESDTPIIKFTMPLDGTIKIKYNLAVIEKGASKIAYIDIMVNNGVVTSDYTLSDEYELKTLCVSAKRGDTITIILACNSTLVADKDASNIKFYINGIYGSVCDMPAISNNLTYYDVGLK